MTAVTFPSLNKTYQMPGGWNELTGEQLIAIAPIVLSGMKPEDASAYIVHALLGWRRDLQRVMRRTRDVSIMLSDIRTKLYPLIEWIFRDNDLVKNVIPEITIPSGFSFLGADRLYGPADNFDNLCIGEFDDAEYWFDLYATSKYQDHHALDMMITVLYRVGKPKHKPGTGDIRQPYNMDLNVLRCVQVEKVPGSIKAAILIWYIGCRTALTKQYGFLFKKGGKDSSLKGWTPIIHDLAGGKFGDLEKTNLTLLKTILYELQLMHIKNEELKSKYPEIYK